MTQLPSEAVPLSKLGSYQNSGSAAGKQVVIAALDKKKATPAEKSLILAMGMQETKDFNVKEADLSAFNLNPVELKKMGYKGDVNKLRDQKNIGVVADTLLNGIRTLGPDKVMNMTRGGDTAENYMKRPDLIAWRSGQVESAKYLMVHPEHWTDGFRTGPTYNKPLMHGNVT